MIVSADGPPALQINLVFMMIAIYSKYVNHLSPPGYSDIHLRVSPVNFV